MFGVRFYHQEWLGFAGQKNMAIDMATGEWILSIDADEILTPELVEEIRAVLDSDIPENIAGFEIPRILFIGNKAVKRGGFYPDAQLRLFRRERGRFRERMVHEAVAVDGDVLQLNHPMLHFSYRDIDQFAAAMDKYARLSAQHYYNTGYKPWRINPINEMFHPMWTFFYRQILRLGFVDGPLCLKANVIYADYVRKKIRYLRELARENA
jgi:glycosyltransferase involved in cell wall biosynthesis